MQILPTKASRDRSGSGGVLKQIFPNYGVLILLLICMGGALFAGGALYGGYLHRTTQSATIIDMLRGLVQQNFKVIPNYINGLAADPAVLFIDMKNNDYQKLAWLRQKTLASGDEFIPDDVVNEYVPGKLSVFGNDEKHSAKLSLHGRNFDHIGLPRKWSFGVDLKGDDLIFGMNQFTLLVPKGRARVPFSEWLNHRLEQYVGLISLNYDFVKVVLNGKNLGVYALEENFDKRLLERNERREGIIIRVREQQDYKLFKAKKVAENPVLAEQAQQLETIWAGFWAGDIPASALFDVDKLARYYALSDLVNGHHTHFLGNEFFYLSPITRLLEPVGREWSSPHKRDGLFHLFVESLNPRQKPELLEPNIPLYHGLIYRDVEFTRLYFEYLRQYASPEFLNAFIASEQEEIARTTAILHSEFPYLDISPDYLFEQIDYINKYMDSDFSAGVAIYQSAEGAPGSVVVKNSHNFPLLCHAIRAGENRHSIKQTIERSGETLVQLPGGLVSNNAHSSYMDCTVPGINKPFEVKIFPWAQSEALAKNRYPVADYADHPGILVDGMTLTVPAGPITLTENLVISDQQSLNIAAGAEIDLRNGAFILSYGPVTFAGTATTPIRVFSSDGTGRGVVVLNAAGQSTVSHTVFSDLTPAEFPGWAVTAAVLFHESPVTIDNASFLKSNSEDALNIVRSNFTISNSLFDANRSDAFDSDFSRGTINNTKFLATGNDAIDTSGSTLAISDILIVGAGDKGISVGEGSTMTGTGLTVQNSGIAISSKDKSTFEFENITLENNALAFALFRKKPEYGFTQGIVRNLSITGDGEEFLVEAGSSLEIDGRLMAGNIDDVKILMYGNVYGKKSVR